VGVAGGRHAQIADEIASLAHLDQPEGVQLVKVAHVDLNFTVDRVVLYVCPCGRLAVDRL
jgi:hypothetical protein